MTARRPLVQDAGFPKELPSGDTILGVPAKIPVLLNGGTGTYINLSVTSTLPLLLNTGSTYNLPVTVNG